MQGQREATIIPPTIGRVVHFHPHQSSPYFGLVLAALVTRVWNDRMVDLAVFPPNGGSNFSETSVHLAQEGDPRSDTGRYAAWMPYQLGQANRTHKLEAQLAETTAKGEALCGVPKPYVHEVSRARDGAGDRVVAFDENNIVEPNSSYPIDRA